tara:strand:+ start:5926 stop:6186 length:261 start_codon:yes stop_codon:yes gene_type:complete
MNGFDFDFKSSKTTHTFLRKGQGKRMSNRFQGMDRDFLRKGEGKLVSSGHGETEFAKKRQRDIIDEQFAREEEYYNKKNDDKDNKK